MMDWIRCFLRLHKLSMSYFISRTKRGHRVFEDWCPRCGKMKLRKEERNFK